MTVEEFMAWSLEQPGDQRFELVDGRVEAMAPPVADHARAIKRIVRGLDAAIEAAGLPCEAFVDGPGVRAGARTLFIPDVLLHCGERLPGDARELDNPILVVEVVSPSTRHLDEGNKLIGYFGLPSVRHYLLVDTLAQRIVHHHRRDDGVIVTSFHATEPIRLDPPGISLEGIFPAAG